MAELKVTAEYVAVVTHGGDGEAAAEPGTPPGCRGCVIDGVDHTCGFEEPIEFSVTSSD